MKCKKTGIRMAERIGRLFLLTTFLILSLLSTHGSANSSECETCIPCHGNLDTIHGDFSHSAAPGSGPVAIFADTDHDDAGWYGPTPYFSMLVDCTLCHASDLPAVHGGDCSTCHPTPYDSLGVWNKGCQQAACHPFIHQDVVPSHYPYEDPYDDNNNCRICHESSWDVPQSNCLNCHAGYGNGDSSPPTTTTNALAEYIGPAKFGFSIKDNGKVGVGRTFYRLDGGQVVAAGKNVLITEPGPHDIEFWSKDQSGNTETAPKYASFFIIEDTSPPTTTSNARSSYSQGAQITLTATDDGTLGVKKTYYRLNDGAIQVGNIVSIPATSGTYDYKLIFWSEDWSGNIEAQQSVNFTVTSGTGTIKLVWGSCDIFPEYKPVGKDAADWTIRKGSFSGPIVARGYGAAPNWDGIDYVNLPIGPTPYFVRINWYWSAEDWDDQTDFRDVYLTTPGQVVRLSY